MRGWRCSGQWWVLMKAWSTATALLSSLLLCGCAFAKPSNDQTSDPPGAPPLKCELTLSSWCIAEGVFELKRTLATDSINDRVWYLKGRFRPESILVVMEPNGCKSGFADSASLLHFTRDHPWEGRMWDRAEVQLKADGTCNLTFLLPPDDGDPMEWAYSTGLVLVRPCETQTCSGSSLSAIKAEIGVRRSKSRQAND